MAEARSFYTVPRAEHTRRGLCGTLPAPFVRCNLGRWLVGSVYVIDWHTERLVRYCFYPRERFTLERPNSIRLSVCIGCLPWGQALRTYGSPKNISSIPSYKVDVNMLSCSYGQTQTQTYN